jgi:hypothetical protein
MEKSNLQEKLVSLYLRLNGYTTTGLILHSHEDGQVDGEIDIIGVRLPFHNQEDRIIQCSETLEIPEKKIDIIIGEVKGGKAALQFNESLRTNQDRVRKLIKWIGIAEDSDVDKISVDLTVKIQNKNVQKPESFPEILHENYCLRPILFAPDRTNQRENQIKFINGNELITFCWNCFRPENRRESCETNYRAISNWGQSFEKLVGYFKNPDKDNSGNIRDLYNHFNIK